MELDLALSTGDYLVRGPRLPVSTALRIQSSGAPSQLQILLDSDGRDNSVGVHRGSAIVSTVNGRLDYFGLTMRQALALPDVSGTGVSVTESIFADPQVHEFLSNCGIPSRMHSIALPGKVQQIVQRYPQKA